MCEIAVGTTLHTTHIAPFTKSPHRRRAAPSTCLNAARFWLRTFAVWQYIRAGRCPLYAGHRSVNKPATAVTGTVTLCFHMPTVKRYNMQCHQWIEDGWILTTLSNTDRISHCKLHCSCCTLGFSSSRQLFLSTYRLSWLLTQTRLRERVPRVQIYRLNTAE